MLLLFSIFSPAHLVALVIFVIVDFVLITLNTFMEKILKLYVEYSIFNLNLRDDGNIIVPYKKKTMQPYYEHASINKQVHFLFSRPKKQKNGSEK